MKRITAVSELRAAVAGARLEGKKVGLVPTMGALHAGHLSLVAAAASACDLLVVSIFVNPLQFGPGEDLESYPRDIDSDERLLDGLGLDRPHIVFAPTVGEVYPRPVVTTVHVAGLTEGLCGARRPGHFDGVTTVVAKLFNLVQPDVAFFGRKDFQQLQTIRRMVADLNIPVDVVGCPIVRESDGVAMSSRNRYLDAEHREAAKAISRGLAAAVSVAHEARAQNLALDAGMLERAVRVILHAQPKLTVDYVEVLHPDSLAPFEPNTALAAKDGEAPAPQEAEEVPALLVAVAAQVGPARLIDNVLIGDEEDENRLLEAVRSQSVSE